MKLVFSIFGLALLALAAPAALPQPDLIAQIHFAGAQKIFASTNVNAFTNEFCSAEALTLRAQMASKLSVWLSGRLQTRLNVSVTGGQTKLRPLFDDLQTSEWFLEARAASNGRPEVALAIKLDPGRMSLWQANLKPFLATANFKSSGGWLIFDSTPSSLGLGERLIQKISTPQAGWFYFDVNWPRLAQWLPDLKELGVPETQLTITAPDDNFRIDGKFYFPDNLALNLEPWRVPTNTLHQPFDSFTAVRGFASWLQSQKWVQPFLITPVPNELFTWSMPSALSQHFAPFMSFAAMPIPNAASALSQEYARLAPAFNAWNTNDDFMSDVTPEIHDDQVNFIGLPFMTPDVRALSEPAGQFLFFETFPNTSRSRQPIPPQLFTRLATPNLVFYHWEITAVRIPAMLQMSQWGMMATQFKQLEAEMAAFKWLHRFGGTLGNTDTEITQSGPAEFTFVRKASGIFTAGELITLANWLEAASFPGCDLKEMPLSPKLKQARDRRRHQQQTPHVISIPTPPPGH